MKLFSFNRKQVAVLGTVMVLAVLGTVYFLVYIPGNERRIQKQRFQALQSIDANIHSKIENSISLLNNTMSDYVKGDSGKKRRLTEYILNFPRTYFTLSMPQKIKYDNSLLGKDSSAVDSAYSLNANNDNQYVRLFYDKNFLPGTDSGVYRIVMEFSYKQFFATLLRENVFDEYIVFKDQKPVYETFPAGISSFQKDTVLGLKNGIAGASIGSYEVGGIDYRFFLQPVRLNSANDWVVGGLLSNEHYQAKKNQLPPQVVLLLVTIALVLLVSFPWLKLYQMGSKDRLTLKDAVASLLISMLLMSLFFFLFFHHNESFRSRVQPNSKHKIAERIHQKFLAETALAAKTLEKLDSLLCRWYGGTISQYDTNKLSKGNNYGIEKKDTLIVRKVEGAMSIIQVFWINEAGQEIINWRLRGANLTYHPYGVYKDRNYFKEINSNGGYSLKPDTAKFYLEQVISWTRFAFTSVIAKRSGISEDKFPVVSCMSFNMKSLEDVLLPAGYEFAVIDHGGKVLYHSDKLRNLNEILTQKIADSNELKSLVAARAPGSFKTTYYDNHYDVEVLPVVGLPYFIVVLEDMAYEDTRVTENYSFTFSMLILFFAFLVLLLFCVFILSTKRSFFKKQSFDTSWIGPRVSCHKEYQLSIIMNVVVIFALIAGFSQPSFLTYLFILFFTVSFLPLFQNSILAKRYFDERKSTVLFKRNAIIGLTIIIFFIDVVAARILDNENVAWLLLYELTLVLAGVGVFLLRDAIFSGLRKLTTAKFSQLVSFRWNYVNSFALMALTRLIITSGIPIVFFYVNSYNYEQNLGVRYRQSDFSDKILKRYKEKELPPSRVELIGKISGVYFDDQTINGYKKAVWPDTATDSNSTEDTVSLQLLRQFRLNLKDQAVKQHRYYRDVAGDSSFRFNHILRENCQKANTSVLYRKDPQSGSAFILKSGPVNYSFPDCGINKQNGFLFWLLLVLGLLVFYFLIYKITRKIFALGLPDIDTWKQLDHNILSNKLLNGTLFVIGLPGSGKKNFLKDKILKKEITLDNGEAILVDDADEGRNNGFVAELVNIPSSGNEPEQGALWKKYTKKVFDEKHKLIIVNHFEYNIQDPVSNHYKLEFLEHLYLETHCKIIILSTIHPVAFLDSMEHFNKEENKIAPGQDLERWHVLLGHYRIVVLPLQLGISNEIPAANLHLFLKSTLVDARDNKPVQNALVTIKDTGVKTTTNEAGEFYLQKECLPFTVCFAAKGFRSTEIQLDERSNEIIGLEEDDSFIFTELTLKETSNTYFLRNMQQSVFEIAENVPQNMRIEKFDDLAFKLQITSHYFYMYIWQSLTKEEKFLLYDLAEDNLVNSYDDYNLSMLLSKGVIVRRDGSLKFFNKGFRNFILSAIGNLEAVKIKNQINENGNWSKLKGPLQIVIIAIIFFLFASQEEAFSKILGYVAALGAGIPAILKLFSLFDKTSTRTG